MKSKGRAPPKKPCQNRATSMIGRFGAVAAAIAARRNPIPVHCIVRPRPSAAANAGAITMPATAPTFWIVFTNAAASAAAERPPPISLTVMIDITGNIEPRNQPYPATDRAETGWVGVAAGAEAGTDGR